MIRNIISFSLLFITVNLFSQKQISKGVINYEVTMQIDEAKLDSITKKIKGSPEVKKMIISSMKNQEKINYKLVFNKDVSIFNQEDKLKINENKINLTKIMMGNGIFYTDKNLKIILNQKEAYGQLFIVSLPLFKWTLTQERKIINDYSCYKAYTEKEVENSKGKFISKITAWYTSEIPVNFGPKDYFGLPGLILELQEGNLVFKASKINLSSSKKIELKKPKKGKEITLEEFNKVSKKSVRKSW